MDLFLIILLIVQAAFGIFALFGGGDSNVFLFIIVLLGLIPLIALIGARQRIKNLEDMISAMPGEHAETQPTSGWRCACGHVNHIYSFKCAFCHEPRPKPNQSIKK